MQNPWNKISKTARVLKEDQPFIKQYNLKNKSNKICTDDYPEPFLGNLHSEVYILFGNPAHEEIKNKQCNHIYSKAQEKLIFNNLRQRTNNQKYPIYFFDPIFKDHGGAKWWRERFNPLLNEIITTEEKISSRLFCVELYGYHSKSGDGSIYKVLPSAQYTRKLVSDAIDKDKLILICRGVAKWYHLIPKLATYEHCHLVATNIRIRLSRSTISPTAFRKITKVLTY